MRPYNFTLSEALDFDYLTKDDLKDAIADYEHLQQVCEDSIGTSDPAEIPYKVDQLENEIEEAHDDAQKPSQYLDDIRRAYEDRHGRIFDATDEKLVEWVCEDINNAPDADTVIIKNVDCKLLKQQLRELYDIPNRSEALEGIITMLEAWVDAHY